MSFLILQNYAHDTTNKSFNKLIKTLSNFLNQNFPTKLYRKKFHFLKTLSLSKKKNTNKNTPPTLHCHFNHRNLSDRHSLKKKSLRVKQKSWRSPRDRSTRRYRCHIDRDRFGGVLFGAGAPFPNAKFIDRFRGNPRPS